MEIKLKMPKRALFAAQVDLLRRSVTAELSLTHMAGLIVVSLAVWREVSWVLMAGWCLLHLLVLLVREVAINRMALVPEPLRDHKQDYYKMLSGNIATGLLWAVGICYLSTVLSPEARDICLMAVITIAALGIGVGPIILSYYVVLVIATLSPVAFFFLLSYQASEYNLLIGLLILFAETVMIRVSMLVHRAYRGIIIGNWQNGAMADQLTSMTRSLHEKNAELRQSREHLADLASIDELTLLHNHKHFNSALKIEWRRALRFSSPLSCIIIEIDGFEDYQQHCGEEQANESLQRVALCLKEVVTRAGDMVARYEQAQFAVILPNTAMLDAQQVCKRLISRVMAENIETQHDSAFKVMTVSQGLASCLPGTTGGGDPSRLALCAEQAMLQAKADGGNYYQIYQDEVAERPSLVSEE